jgi:hypothetical protein
VSFAVSVKLPYSFESSTAGLLLCNHVTSRAANRNRGFRALLWELFLTRNLRFLTATDIGLGSRTRDAAPPRAGLPVASLSFGEWRY